MARCTFLPKKTTLAVALAAVFSATAALAGPVCSPTVTGSITNPVLWSMGDCTVTGTINVSSGTALASTGTTNGTLSNSGTISGAYFGISNTGTIGNLSNSGVVSTGVAVSGSSNTAISNTGTIGTLSNSGTISGAYFGIFNTGPIGTLSNSGTISALSGVNFSVDAGLLNGSTGLFNSGTIGALLNSGTISGGISGIFNNGTIGTLTNSGVIRGSVNGISVGSQSSIVVLNNSVGGTIIATGSTISGLSGGAAILNFGTIGTLTNSGTLSGATAALYIEAGGTLGTITNSGVIAGNIVNNSSVDLSINGGSGTVFGTLTGFDGAAGTITNTTSNVAFGAGNLLLNDSINVGSNAVNNTAATLQVNNSVAITGNYNQGAAATLLIGVASGAVTNGLLTSDSGYGRLVVSGSATLAAGSSVELKATNGYGFAAGQRFVVIDASSSGTNYNEGSLNYGISGYSAVLTGLDASAGGRSDLVVTVVSATSGTSPVTLPTAPQLATAPNAVAALTGLTNYTGTNPALLNLFDAAQALSLGSSAAATRAGTQLSPISQASSSRAAAAPELDVSGIVSAHSDSLRLAQADGDSGIATGESPPDLGVWGQGFGGHASQNERDQVDGYSANYGGLLLGVDKSLSDRLRAGGVFSYSNALVNSGGNSAGDSMRVNSYGLLGYASFDGKPWYVNVSMGAVQQRYDTTRAVNFTGFSGVANGQFNGTQYVAQTEVGYPLALGAVTLTPLVSLTYSHLNQDAYTESGGNGAALSIGATRTTSVKTDMGLKVEHAFATSYGALVPDVQLAWRHEYDNTKVLTNASFAADPTGQTGFSTLGASPESDLAVMSVGVTLLRANNLTLTARYELQAASGYLAQTGSVRLRQLF